MKAPLTAKALWRKAHRQVRQANLDWIRDPAWTLHYLTHDKLAGKLDGEVYREQQRRRAKRWVRSMVPFFKGWTA